eukprot:gnl/TRDRNA2_/TRDRNA2_201485_c0_seq1.p1 gnl/TRDRNA2_/TRDRNA2_201485_c0~~gnl/TRDRNA2_/TRDRNA2_201485_c0_seq1.p1  ORF type:complete len:380 (-),score=42.18 gnl/TRDRNA2_/TRDRNA2_201485_c0_seq1:72-1211(-)
MGNGTAIALLAFLGQACAKDSINRLVLRFLVHRGLPRQSDPEHTMLGKSAHLPSAGRRPVAFRPSAEKFRSSRVRSVTQRQIAPGVRSGCRTDGPRRVHRRASSGRQNVIMGMWDDDWDPQWGTAQLPDLPTNADRKISFVAGASAEGGRDDGKFKMLHFIMHAKPIVELHADMFDKDDGRRRLVRKDPKHFDSDLLPVSWFDCHKLRNGTTKDLPPLPDVELVLTSPLSRALQTSVACFGPFFRGPENPKAKAPPIFAIEALREYCSKDFQPCDQRHTREELEDRFVLVNFTFVPPGDDELLCPNFLETPESLNRRIRWLLLFIESRPETSIAVVGHSHILSKILNENLAPSGWDATSSGDFTYLETRSVPILFKEAS